MRDNPHRGQPCPPDTRTKLLAHGFDGDYRDELRAFAGAAILLAVALLFAISGLVFYLSGQATAG